MRDHASELVIAFAEVLRLLLRGLELCEELGYAPGVATEGSVVAVKAVLFVETGVLADMLDI
jgi:hypothetical protein